MQDIVELFPFGSFREKQQETLEAAYEMLESGEYDNVIIDAPTGVGKSAINVALCRAAENAFYTTPQKSLREQLQDDDILSSYYKTLRARRDYTCGVTGDDCEECEVYENAKMSCAQREECTYMNHKGMALSKEIAVTTFSYLIVDSQLPPDAGFEDREVLVVDECHNLANQVASLHMGFEVSPYNLPLEVFGRATKDMPMDTISYEPVEDIVQGIHDRAVHFANKHQDHDDKANQVEQCEEFINYSERFLEDVSHPKDSPMHHPWVIDSSYIQFADDRVKVFDLKPIDVAHFLRLHVWNRADKRILSTATMPYRNNPDAWCAQLGLDPDRTGVIHVRMPFPVRNRPVYTGRMIDDMSGGTDKEVWPEIMKEINSLSIEHGSQRGLIHTASYDRARKIYEDANSGEWPKLEGDIMLHEKDSGMDFVNEWQESDKPICVSPSMTEGVDLYDDRCRWQALLKVPYPSPAQPRVKYLLEERPEQGWKWYYETTSNRIVQSAGRAVRSKSDWANYYVLDKAFDKVRRKVDFPGWFEDAITDNEGRANTALDW